MLPPFGSPSGRIDVPVGTLIAYGGQLEPSSTAANTIISCSEPTAAAEDPADNSVDSPVALVEAQGWMVCDGRSLEVAKYPALYGVLGTLYGQGDEGAGTFKIPDCRGLFLRGVDSGAGMDPDTSDRTAPDGQGTAAGVGSVQCDAVIKHVHSYEAAPPPSSPGQQGKSATIPGTPTETGPPAEPGSVSVAPPNGIEVRTSSETRPRNIAVWYLIKFR
ncbi:MAG: phage tail protein [Acidobacteriota bacterium]